MKPKFKKGDEVTTPDGFKWTVSLVLHAYKDIPAKDNGKYFYGLVSDDGRNGSAKENELNKR